jgi:hypothetical protein
MSRFVSRAFRSLALVAVTAAPVIGLYPSLGSAEPGSYLSRGYPTIEELQADTRALRAYPRAAYPAGGSNDPCHDVRAFPGRFDEATKAACPPY